MYSCQNISGSRVVELGYRVSEKGVRGCQGGTHPCLGHCPSSLSNSEKTSQTLFVRFSCVRVVLFGRDQQNSLTDCRDNEAVDHIFDTVVKWSPHMTHTVVVGPSMHSSLSVSVIMTAITNYQLPPGVFSNTKYLTSWWIFEIIFTYHNYFLLLIRT